MAISSSITKLDFSPLGDGAQRFGQAIEDDARDVHDLPVCEGGGKSLVLPEVAPDQGQRIGEGRMARVLPGGLTDGDSWS